jgi:DNA transformation protein
MPVSPEYRDATLDRLSTVSPVRGRAMFGGVGVYCGDLFFALTDNDRLYFKVDDGNRADFEAAGMGPFMPFGDPAHVMQYYEVPEAVLNSDAELGVWMDRSLAVAERARSRRKKK